MVIISVSQALLLLIEKHQADKEILSKLKKHYLVGVVDQETKLEITEFLKDPILQEYEVSSDPAVIDGDATRRYFETHLSYQTLLATVVEVDFDSLYSHYKNMHQRLKNYLYPEEMQKINIRLKGLKNPVSDVSDYISKITNGTYFKNEKTSTKSKIKLLVACVYLGVRFCELHHNSLPINIYDDDTTYFDKKKRGRELKESQVNVDSKNQGLLKSYMPVPETDLARSEKIFNYLRTADNSRYDLEADWVKNNFSYLVHPFSSSISGTMLCQLRTLRFFFSMYLCEFDTEVKLRNYFKCIISARLYHSGGHSLHEFVFPITLAQVREEFKFIKGFDSIDLFSLFLKGNEVAFDKALQATIAYNKLILNRKKLHEEIEKIYKPSNDEINQSSLTPASQASVPEKSFVSVAYHNHLYFFRVLKALKNIPHEHQPSLKI